MINIINRTVTRLKVETVTSRTVGKLCNGNNKILISVKFKFKYFTRNLGGWDGMSTHFVLYTVLFFLKILCKREWKGSGVNLSVRLKKKKTARCTMKLP